MEKDSTLSRLERAISKSKWGSKAVNEVNKLIFDHNSLLSLIPDATDLESACKSVDKIVIEVKKLREQQSKLLSVLGCDNMHNATLKVEKLMKKELK